MPGCLRPSNEPEPGVVYRYELAVGLAEAVVQLVGQARPEKKHQIPIFL